MIEVDVAKRASSVLVIGGMGKHPRTLYPVCLHTRAASAPTTSTRTPHSSTWTWTTRTPLICVRALEKIQNNYTITRKNRDLSAYNNDRLVKIGCVGDHDGWDTRQLAWAVPVKASAATMI